MSALRIGTRGSALALAQTGLVADDLATETGASTELVTITTAGDRSTEPLSRVGGTGLFTSALRDALLAGECDVIVHSLKDLPTAPHPALTIAAIPVREDPRDALCARDELTLDTLAEGARVGTGSPRRVAQLRRRRPDLEIVDIRGNVDTRLGRVSDSDLDAVILAAAGLRRLRRAEAITDLLDIDRWPTAPGQGALAIEVRAGDEDLVARPRPRRDPGRRRGGAARARDPRSRLLGARRRPRGRRRRASCCCRRACTASTAPSC